jgi:glycosyltransferase involved in cell wall biosynthesis
MHSEDSPIIYAPGDIFLGLDLIHPAIAENNRLMYEDMRKLGVKVYFVLYDLIPLKFPHFANIGVSEGYRKWLNIVLGCDGVFCISRSVADELRELIKGGDISVSPDFRIEWFHLGSDIENSIPSKGLPSNAAQLVSKIRDTITFLMVGTLEPRKGHLQVLNAFDQLWNNGNNINLVIVGKAGWKVNELMDRITNSSELGKRLFYLDSISDEYLGELYSLSSCLIAASYSEGFGLPIVEAARRKIPVIARDIPVFREVAGDGCYYFSEETGEGLAISISTWIHLFLKNSHPTSYEFEHITWEQSSNNLLSIVLKNV